MRKYRLDRRQPKRQVLKFRLWIIVGDPIRRLLCTTSRGSAENTWLIHDGQTLLGQDDRRYHDDHGKTFST